MSLFQPIVDHADLPAIDGLTYAPNYLTGQTEQKIAALIDQQEWDTTWERRRQLFGGAYGKTEQAPRPLPPWGVELAERIRLDGLVPVPFDQMLVNEYQPGQGIAMHHDYQTYGRTVASISLLAHCVMDFHHTDGRRASLLLEPRSILVLRDAARYEWQHGIARRKNDRWHGLLIPRRRRLSITFRHTVMPPNDAHARD